MQEIRFLKCYGYPSFTGVFATLFSWSDITRNLTYKLQLSHLHFSIHSSLSTSIMRPFLEKLRSKDRIFEVKLIINKVSVYPKIDHFFKTKKCFSLFQIDLIANSHLKKIIWEKIDSKQGYKRKTFLCIKSCVTDCRVAQLSNVWKSTSCSECSPFVNCWFELKYVVEETQRFVFICKCEENITEDKVGKERFQKHSIRIVLMRQLASDKGSCFEQEKLLALDKEDIWHSLSITSLALLKFEVVTVTVTSQINRYLVAFLYRCLRVRSFVPYGIF